MPASELALVDARAVVAVRGRRTVLGPVDLCVRSGERIALLGPNGAGKSTLLRLLAGTEAARAGRVELAGIAVGRLRAPERARRVALGSQQLPPAVGWTVRELVLLGRTPHRSLGRPSSADRHAVAAAIEAFRIGWLEDRRVDTLSGGEQRLAHLARVVAQGAPLLLLDEPLAHLDPANVALALDAVSRVAQERHGAVVAALHEPSHALAWASRIVLLRRGAIVADVPADALDDRLLASCYDAPLRVLRSADGDSAAVATRLVIRGERRG